MKAKTLVILLDADGCFYNKKYQRLLLYVICRHGDFIKELMTTVFNTSCSPEKQVELQNKFELIQQEVKKVKLHKRDYLELIKEAQNKFWPDKKTFLPGEMDKLLAGLSSEYIAYLDELKREFLDALLCRANERLIEKIHRSVAKNNVEKIIFMVGSNRQSLALDEANKTRKGTRYFFQDLVMFVDEVKRMFASETNVQISLDKFLLADVYSMLPPGETYKLALNELNNFDCYNRPTTIFDKTKLTTIYGFLHYIATNYKDDYENGKVLVEYYDDSVPILSALENTFNVKHNQDVLPKNMPLSVYYYAGNKIDDEKKFVIEGAGTVDACYRDNVKKIAQMSKESPVDTTIDAAILLNFSEFRKQRLSHDVPPSMTTLQAGLGMFAQLLRVAEDVGHDVINVTINRQ